MHTVLFALLLGMPAWAQGDDPFAGYHATLTGAADAALAQILAQRTAEITQTPAVPQDPGRNLRNALDRVQKLRPVVEPILREQGVPSELAALMLVESGGRTTALSPKGARGLWQLMPETARRYGLVVTAKLDERLDTAKSTRAAARYLGDLHAQFGDWRLALAAYNAGEQLVARALQRSGARDFFQISSMKLIPAETRNYVPAMQAALRLLGSGEWLGTTASKPRHTKVRYAEAGMGN
jgi:membrane-bound lytic murein transglycosylase D